MEIIGIAEGERHGLVLTKDGKFLGWGTNDRGQLGIYNQENRSLLRPLGIFPDNIISIAAEIEFFCIKIAK